MYHLDDDWDMSPARIEPDKTTYSGRFAARLRALREKAGLTVPELTKATGIPQRTLYSWESAERMPHYDTLPILAESFGVKVRTLLPDE